MDEDRAGTVREWNSRSIEGHAGLGRLASEEFSGVIETDRGSIRAFMTNGRIVEIDRGGIEDLDGMSMTAYSAPDDAVPLLFAMQERNGDPRAQYYTEDTPLPEVNRTLEEAGFTGYVELSENVLSGDYYVVYHGGRSSSVAFVGSSSRLMTGEEAFERAADEVGIYKVIDVDVSVIDVPGTGDSDAAGDAGGANAVAGTESGSPTPAGTGTRSDAADTGGPPATPADPGPDGGDADPAADDSTPPAGTGGGPSGPADPGLQSADVRGGTGTGSSGGSGPYGSGEEIRVGAGLGTDDGEGVDPDADADTAPGSDAGRNGDAISGAGGEADARADAGDPAGSAPSGSPGTTEEGPTDGPADGREAGSDDGTAAGGGSSGTEAEAEAGTGSSRGRSPGSSDGRPASDADEAPSAGGADAADRSAGRTAARADSPERAGDGAADPDTGETEGAGPAPGSTADAREGSGRAEAGGGPASGPTRDRLASELAEAREALERVRAERDDYRDDAERLRERIATLEARIEALEEGSGDGDGDGGEESADGEGDGGGAAAAPERSISPREALAGTNLFVRYQSKAEPTLEDAHGGNADPTAVNRNIRIEQHTRFETAGLAVDGEPFDSFLTSTFEYQFAEWVIRDLLYELRSTGSRAAMEQLYDAIPAIDRVEFEGEVQIGTVQGADDGEESADARQFDVVFRDRMGGPLLVANLRQTRDPTPAATVTTLIEDARTVAVAAETIGAAFVVTTSYYEPQALEAASSATGGGFLSRTRKESYVKMKRKRGFHLCLLEARDGEFNLRLPEL